MAGNPKRETEPAKNSQHLDTIVTENLLTRAPKLKTLLLHRLKMSRRIRLPAAWDTESEYHVYFVYEL